MSAPTLAPRAGRHEAMPVASSFTAHIVSGEGLPLPIPTV